MPTQPRLGAVIYAKNVARLARFYEQLCGLPVVAAEGDHVVLGAGPVELVIHAIPKRVAQGIQIQDPPEAREDTPIKLVFAVPSLADVRTAAPALGGSLGPVKREWDWPARGFRACDGLDPEGNVVQFRQALPPAAPPAGAE